ncbi:hypothetical protein [Acidisphaera sp. S103]|uniref:hypothetical protein n=1 Tax=Acidisphaera sp. S103 TaxID=1747223 RepID=UPI00131EBF5C|nr:hypothetical protein [Acidisphaera sp. S103]
MRQLVAGIGLLLLAACGRTDQQKSVDLLQQRLHTRMADAVSAGAATIQDLPDGAIVTFPDGRPAADPRTDLVEALLDPGLLRIGIVAPAGLPPYAADRRVQAWEADFRRTPIGPALRPPSVMPQPSPNGMTVSIQVVCPDRSNGWGYDVSHSPACF